ncbi:hypothetical protein SAMN05444280_11190 [Tangfeifania diversioriginum]|uniref:Uncharacterized protein n=1 Tax=Tangfeifania diversioriginum TaxID=1168035 RepID=A0A1M6GRA1_9BACT|nr:hypothetical protein [Tangfeifania diversioriginum]SHJ12495.1 hypothetical protein SAMN05444280_11190 [Tangfeifania diversioriginum]
MNLTKANILYFDANKTIYTRGIKEAFERSCNSVDFFSYDEFNRKGIIGKVDHSSYTKERESKINEMFNYIKKRSYDIILIKAPFMIEHEFFQRLIFHFPNATKINYNWSSVEKFDFLPYKKYFDIIYSFDIKDCEKYELNYHPLFYLPEFKKIGLNHPKKFDISFIGTYFNKGRYEFFQDFIKLLNNKNKKVKHKFYFYSPNKKKNLKLLFKNPSTFKYIGSNFLPLNSVVEIMSNSVSMIDYPMDIQTGLTMRTFETIAAGLLLITTNEYIKREPFYDSERIKIIKPDLSDFDFDFIHSYIPSWDPSFEKYSIDNWIKNITDL